MALVSIIKNDNGFLNDGLGSKSVMAWKFLEEDFNVGSQLIVSEAEEAVFIKDGVAVQVFEGGRYRLESNNYPFLGALIRKFTGGVQAFSCKVYYVNKDHKLELRWGTDTPIQLRDPALRIQTSISARGSYSVEVSDSKKFLMKLIGNNIQLFTDEELNMYFRSAFLQYIKDAIAKHIKDSGREILEICTDKTLIAESLKLQLTPVLDEYGVRLVNFYVSAIDIPTDDPNREKLEEAFAQKGVMGILGDDWARQQSATILGDLANNPGSGGIAAMGAGLGMGVAAGGAFSEMAGQMFRTPLADSGAVNVDPVPAENSRFLEQPGPASTPASEQPSWVVCPGCSQQNPNSAKFCAECGGAMTTACKGCGSELPPVGKFCSECGRPR